MERSSVRKKLGGIRMSKKTISLIMMCMILLLSDYVLFGTCAGKKAHVPEVKNKRSMASEVGNRKKEKNKDKRSSSKGFSRDDKKDVTKGKRAIVPVRKESIASKAFKGITVLKSSFKSSAGAALSSTSKVQRQFKSYFSSDFEVLLLRMTTPDDLRLAEDDLERFIATIETFVRNMDVTSQSNPYRVTLRKIWSKAAEIDGKTVLKAQFLLHTLLRGTTPEDSLIFKTLLKKMLREKCKKTKSKYFDITKISTVSLETKHLKDFITRYSIYIFQRAKTFTSGFEEMKLIGDGMRTEDICAQVRISYYFFKILLNVIE